MRRVSALLSFLFAFMLPGCGGAQGERSPQAVAAYERGRKFFDQFMFDHAISDFNEAIRLDPSFQDALMSRGAAWQAKGDFAKAIADYDEAIRLDPKKPAPFVSRAACWNASRDFDKAIADYEEALRIDPKYHIALHNFALLLATAPDGKGFDAKRAIHLAKQALDLDEKNPHYMENLATAYAANGDFAEAVSWQEKAMQNPVINADPQARLRLNRYIRKEPRRR